MQSELGESFEQGPGSWQRILPRRSLAGLSESCREREALRLHRKILFLVGLFVLALVPVALAAEAAHPPAFSWKKEAFRYLNFALLVIGVYYLFKIGLFDLDKVVKHFTERPRKVDKAIEEAKAARAEAEAKRAEYEAKIARVEEEIANIEAEGARRTEAMRAELAQAAEEAARRVAAEAQERIAEETEQARADLQREASLLAIELAEEILKEKVDEEDQRRLVERTLRNLEDLR
jgi:F0F1-type ATP synthase membrane subunit b/b'